MNISEGYSTEVRYSPQAATDEPACIRFLPSIILQKSRCEYLPLPTFSIVPTMALTMFLRNLSAVMVKDNLSPCISQFADFIVQKSVLLLEFDFLKLEKSL